MPDSEGNQVPVLFGCRTYPQVLPSIEEKDGEGDPFATVSEGEGGSGEEGGGEEGCACKHLRYVE